MKLLVINSGSSSIKYEVFESSGEISRRSGRTVRR
jgi:acetate kinase